VLTRQLKKVNKIGGERMKVPACCYFFAAWCYFAAWCCAWIIPVLTVAVCWLFAMFSLKDQQLAINQLLCFGITHIRTV